MTLFQKLRDWIDDDPVGLFKLAEDDQSIKESCIALTWAAFGISNGERKRRRLFASPVSPKFIAAWREYEERYSSVIDEIFAFDFLGEDFKPTKLTAKDKSEADSRWEKADLQAQELANSFAHAIELAEQYVSDEMREFEGLFRQELIDGIDAWQELRKEAGFDLRGTLRRRDLIPFVLVPRHVSDRVGEKEQLSLLTLLQQAHEAFIFGVHFAALALMRSVLEVTLKDYYLSEGRDLEERINNCQKLPKTASKAALHRLRHLANDILHFNKEKARLPADFEREILWLLLVLRALIENAPTSRMRTAN